MESLFAGGATLPAARADDRERSETGREAQGTAGRPIARQGSRSGDAAREAEREVQRPAKAPTDKEEDGIPTYGSDEEFEDDEEDKADGGKCGEGGGGGGGRQGGTAGLLDDDDDLDYEDDYDLDLDDDEEDDLPPFPGAEPPRVEGKGAVGEEHKDAPLAAAAAVEAEPRQELPTAAGASPKGAMDGTGASDAVARRSGSRGGSRRGRGSSRQLQDDGTASRAVLQEGDDPVEKVYELSKQLVEQGQRTYWLSQQLEEAKGEIKELRGAEAATRRALMEALQRVQGEDVAPGSVAQYKNVPLLQLAKLLENAKVAGAAATGRASSRGSTGGQLTAGGAYVSTLNLSRASSTSRAAADTDLGDSETPTTFKAMKARLSRVEKDRREMQRELASLRATAKDARAMRARYEALTQRVLTEKTGKESAESAVETEREKVEALSEHIEKLMVHLKHEAAAKARAIAASNKANKEAALAAKRFQAVQRRGEARERLMLELKQQIRVLEGQLRLMDEKYIDLRSLLDRTRTNSALQIKRLQKEADELYTRLAMAGSMGQRVLSGSLATGGAKGRSRTRVGRSSSRLTRGVREGSGERRDGPEGGESRGVSASAATSGKGVWASASGGEAADGAVQQRPHTLGGGRDARMAQSMPHLPGSSVGQGASGQAKQVVLPSWDEAHRLGSLTQSRSGAL